MALLTLLLTISVMQVYALQPILTEGTRLVYRGAIMGVPQGGVNTWEETVNIYTYNGTALVFEREVQDKTYQFKVTYEDGIPIFVDYPGNLIYLPAESLALSLNQELGWVKKMKTSQGHVIENVTAQKMNFTVELGTFQCINITLSIVGMDYGRFSYLFDVESGILIYDQWVPLPYGDVYAYGLVDAQFYVGVLSAQNLILPALSLAIPIVMLTHQIFLICKNRKNRISEESLRKKLNSNKSFLILVFGALFFLSSVFMPWSQISKSGVYLLFSFPATLGSYIFLPSTSNYEIISLAAFTSAILAWLGISLGLYMQKRIIPTLATILSVISASVSIFLFIQTRWTASFGLQILVVGMVLEIVGTVASNVNIELIPKETVQQKTKDSISSN